ncbi:MAG: hypothetical protein WC125_10090 [Bacteroidales bacterium]
MEKIFKDEEMESLINAPETAFKATAITSLICLRDLLVKEAKNGNTEQCYKLGETIAKIIQASNQQF